MDPVTQEIQELKKRLTLLEQQRVSQAQLLPGAVKNRHLAEPNTYLRVGLLADKPTNGSFIKLGGKFFGTSVWFAYDNNKLYIWNPSTLAWKSVQLA